LVALAAASRQRRDFFAAPHGFSGSVNLVLVRLLLRLLFGGEPFERSPRCSRWGFLGGVNENGHFVIAGAAKHFIRQVVGCAAENGN
jgi:hypothetical protein